MVFMRENEFLLNDRITKIKSFNELYNLEDNAYISFSGGKDSTVLHYLIDLAIPENKIPRVYINTGIEYKKIVEFVERERERDSRILIIKPEQNIKATLERYGYPFKSKEHSQKVSYYQNSGLCKTVKDYIGAGNKNNFLCPNNLKYNFTKDFNIKVSDKCCHKMKKDPAKKWAAENKKSITITGMRATEGGIRNRINCAVFNDATLKKFHPLAPLDDDFIKWFVENQNIKLCDLYYPPFNFERTGCKGCPFSLDLERQLEIMSYYLPEERKQCEYIWQPIYKEYRRIKYRLDDSQPLLF